MRTQALCKSLSFKRLSLATALVTSMLAGSLAQASPFSAYAGASMGIAPSPRSCNDANVCDRAAMAGKAVVGYNATPNVAVEINYFYFGGLNTAFSGPQTAANGGIASIRENARAITLGINWNIELFQIATSHIRLGVASTQLNKTITNSLGVSRNERDYSGSPYFGLGASIPFNQNVRFVTGYDFLIGGHASHHLFSAGFQGEF
jgi:OmpA-like transmembrane domain